MDQIRIERVAKALCLSNGVDPGETYLDDAEGSKISRPKWHLYIDEAKRAIELHDDRR